MKTKISSRFLTLTVVVLALVFSVYQCKNVEPTEWPAPSPEVNSQIKFAVFESENGSLLQDYDIKVILPDGTSQEFSNKTGALTIDGSLEGTYVITASKVGYLAENILIDVENATEENISTVTVQEFYLNKKGTGSMVTPVGTTLTVANDMEQLTTVEFPEGALSNDQNVVVSFIQPPYKNGDLKILGERVLIKGYDFSPDMTFDNNVRPTVNIPLQVTSVIEGAPVYFGTYDMTTDSWEMIEGSLNETRTVASFEMPHFSTWWLFTGYRLVKTGTSWAPWAYVAESDTCSSGACGTYIYSVAPTALIKNLISFGYNINLKAKDTRCVGPHFQYAQVLYARCELINYNVYDYTGVFVGSIQIPVSKFQWMVEEYYCHDQGGGK